MHLALHLENVSAPVVNLKKIIENYSVNCDSSHPYELYVFLLLDVGVQIICFVKVLGLLEMQVCL